MRNTTVATGELAHVCSEGAFLQASQNTAVSERINKDKCVDWSSENGIANVSVTAYGCSEAGIISNWFSYLLNQLSQ